MALLDDSVDVVAALIKAEQTGGTPLATYLKGAKEVIAWHFPMGWLDQLKIRVSSPDYS